jgi:hypothetical protein
MSDIKRSYTPVEITDQQIDNLLVVARSGNVDLAKNAVKKLQEYKDRPAVAEYFKWQEELQKQARMRERIRAVAQRKIK